MNPRDFYRTAEELLRLHSSLESNYRSAISRGYYSNFILIQSSILKQARAGLLSRAQLSTQLSHEWAASALVNSKIDEIVAIGKKLQHLCSVRKRADYRMELTIGKSDAIVALQNAADLIAAIDSFGLPKIIAYIIQHIRDLAQTRTGTPSI